MKGDLRLVALLESSWDCSRSREGRDEQWFSCWALYGVAAPASASLRPASLTAARSHVMHAGGGHTAATDAIRCSNLVF